MTATYDEDRRLEALYSLGILDMPPEEAFEGIVRIAKELFNAPVANINLIDSRRQWTMAGAGTMPREIERRHSFCTWTIEQDRPFVVRDAHSDPRFDDCPIVQDGPRYRFYAGAPLTDRSGNKLGALCCLDYEPRCPSDPQLAALKDLARLTVDLLELREIATTDGLTGAMTRRSFMEAGRRDVDLAHTHERRLCALIIDFDHFKAINDTYGHHAGDYVLRRGAEVLMGQLRGSDYMGRLGGEEFGVFLRETSFSEAFEVAEKLRVALADTCFEFEAIRLRISASFGLATLEEPVGNVVTLLQRADDALYAAKAAGRNRTVKFVARGSAGSA